MATTLKDFLVEHPVDRERVDAHKGRMLAEVRAYRLRELREQAGLTQAQLAARIGVGQRQVSKIEHGDLDSAKIGTIRSYLEAVGGELALEYVIGDQRVQVACTAGIKRHHVILQAEQVVVDRSGAPLWVGQAHFTRQRGRLSASTFYHATNGVQSGLR